MDEPTQPTVNFLNKLQALPPGPGVSLDDVLAPAIEFESDLRKLFATDRENTRLSDPYVGLINIFDAPEAARTTRARVVQGDEDLSARYVMPLEEKKRRADGSPCVVPDLEEFRSNWAIFTEGSLSQLKDWSNIVAAGGSVLACLGPLTEEMKESKRNIRQFYHNEEYPTSDVDLFLWGLNAQQAEEKIKKIYKAVRDSVPWDVTCVRTKHTVSIQSQYPYRSVQIILRLYHSPAEILAGFDIDAPCCLYDGKGVYANPRSIVAMMRQCNTVDITRRSPSYEVRLAKYSKRGFEVYVPDLRRNEIDPTIYERSIARMEGLARLLVLEKLKDTETRYAFLESRRSLRNRPEPGGRHSNRRKVYKGDLKSKDVVAGLEQNDYDVQNLHIPYGPGWDARRIEKLIYQTDLGMNSTFNPKNKGRRLHRHPAFFGTVDECLEDCCEFCPDPIDDDEKKLQETESEKYIRGRVTFIEENPGRQSMTGSFNPIDDGEWSDQAYIKPTQQLFAAIATKDRETVKLLIKDLDVNQRDHVGRTPLHVALMCRASQIACDLIDAGARITARLVDGRTPLHLACQYDLPDVIRKLFEQSAKNEEEEKLKNPEKAAEAEEKAAAAKAGGKDAVERPSSEDDWSSHSDDDVDMIDKDEVDDGDDDAGDDEDDSDKDDDEDNKDDGGDDDDEGSDGSDHSAPARTPSPGPPDDIPDDETEEPDIIDINLLDWDFGFPAIAYAIIYGSLEVLELLLTNKADLAIPTKPVNVSYRVTVQLHPLELTLLRDDEDEACKIAERLITAGATCSTANEHSWTGFHSIVAYGKVKVLHMILKCDKNAPVALNFPSTNNYSGFTFPIISAVSRGHYGVVALLASHGVRLEYDEADITRAQDACSSEHRCDAKFQNSYVDLADQVVEAALARQDDIVQLLLALGAPVNLGIKQGLVQYVSEYERASLVDWTTASINKLKKRLTTEEQKLKKLNTKVKALPKKPTWKQAIEHYQRTLSDEEQEKRQKQTLELSIHQIKDTKSYLDDVKRLLVARGAKSWAQLFPKVTSTFNMQGEDDDEDDEDGGDENVPGKLTYFFITKAYSRRKVPEHLKKQYDELFAACYAGDDKKVEKLCRPTNPKDKALIISVYLSFTSYEWGKSEGYTPLFAAVEGRRWSTVKLILSIVASQYKPVDKNKKFNPKILKIESEDDDNSDYNSDSDGDETEKEEPKFTDIASHTATSEISPRKFLDVPCEWRVGKRYGTSTLLSISTARGDVEAFVQLANLYQGLPERDGKLDKDLIGQIVASDCPEVLDEYIRRTGLGIELKVPEPADGKSDVPIALNDENKLYLGLNVHGKKRKDLATRDDPHAVVEHEQPPLVWQAAKAGSKQTIEYLSSGLPLAAYKHYASTRSDTRAMVLRRIADLEKELPATLGWSVNSVGESPLTAALMEKPSVKILELLLATEPEFMKTALHKRIKYIGDNLLLLAVRLHEHKKPDVIDFLLSQSLDPTIQDMTRGWNIYHHACQRGDVFLVKHLLEKLPREINEGLLRQQSKERYNTPLHVAIHSRVKDLVKAIVDYDPETLKIRNVHGRLPLHSAVTSSYAQITEYLLSKGDVTALQVEDGVGHTIIDLASLVELRSRADKYHDELSSYRHHGTKVSYREPGPKARYLKDDITELEKQLGRLREAVELITPEEKRKRRTKLLWEVTTFISLMEKKLKQAKDDLPRVTELTEWAQNNDDEDSDEEGDDDEEDSDTVMKDQNKSKRSLPKDAYDEAEPEKTYAVVSAAAKTLSPSAPRQLVHVSHVQKSVVAGLTTAINREVYQYRDYDDLHQKEEDPEVAERAKSMLFKLNQISIKGDDVK